MKTVDVSNMNTAKVCGHTSLLHTHSAQVV
jgi:hypothetical protein